MSKGLEGLNVTILESRNAQTMKQLVELQGGRAFSAPSMKEVPIADNPAAFIFAEKLFANEIDLLVLLTGVGTRALVSILETRYPKEDIFEALRRTAIAPRGPKPIRVLRDWNIPYALEVPEPNTWRELLAELDKNTARLPLKGKRVAVQEYGVPNPELLDGLRSRGASVLDVPVYRWTLPDDIAPLTEAVNRVLAGKTDVVMLTTAVQIEHFLQIADKSGGAGRLKSALERVVVASIGPDCSEAIRARGIAVDIEPETPKMAPFVIETAIKAKDILARKR